MDEDIVYSPKKYRETEGIKDYSSGGKITKQAYLSDNVDIYPELEKINVQTSGSGFSASGYSGHTSQDGIDTYTFNSKKTTVTAGGVSVDLSDGDHDEVTLTYNAGSAMTAYVGSVPASGGAYYIRGRGAGEICLKSTTVYSKSSLSFSGMEDPIPSGGNCTIRMKTTGTNGTAAYKESTVKKKVLVPATFEVGTETTGTFLVKQSTPEPAPQNLED